MDFCCQAPTNFPAELPQMARLLLLLLPRLLPPLLPLAVLVVVQHCLPSRLTID